MATARASTDDERLLSHPAREALTPLPTTLKGDLSVDYQRAGATSTYGLEGYLPLLPGQQQVLFLQSSWYRQQQQDTISVGLGHRWDTGNAEGAGYHLFYDHLRPHHRVGLGLEGWWHTLSLAANGYLPLSNGRPLPSANAYRALPARGFDLAVKGYLPDLPQLVGSLHYSRFLGNVRVNMQQQYQLLPLPAIWAVGLHYTPLPLLTLRYHFHSSQKQQPQHQISLRFTYRFHHSLRWQCDPAQVSSLRSLDSRWLERRVERQATTMVLAHVNRMVPADERIYQPKNGQRLDPEQDTVTLRQRAAKSGIPLPICNMSSANLTHHRRSLVTKPKVQDQTIKKAASMADISSDTSLCAS